MEQLNDAGELISQEQLDNLENLIKEYQAKEKTTQDAKNALCNATRQLGELASDLDIGIHSEGTRSTRTRIRTFVINGKQVAVEFYNYNYWINISEIPIYNT